MTCCMKNTFPVSAILLFSRSLSTHSFNIITIVIIFCSRHHIWEQGIKRIIPFGNMQAASVRESFRSLVILILVEYYQEVVG